MWRLLRILILLLILVFVGSLYGVYLYLKPEDAYTRIASPSSVRTTHNGEIIGSQGSFGSHAWFGIPYASPPIGPLRWQAPRPVESWPGRRSMFEYGESCLQLPAIPGSDDDRGFVGSEDCLYLNIWAPVIGPTKIPQGDDRLPVMFWIHGGGNTIGSGGSERTQIYDGSLMAAEHKVIVVTVNYRLGPMGWLYHDALRAGAGSLEDASGNYGTLDLVAALHWVQRNIAAFGGDPGNVTIFGESAGGFNVLSLMASPLGEGLFHRAIVQSGALDIASPDEAQQIGINNRGDLILSSREIVGRWLVADGQAANRTRALQLQDELSTEQMAGFMRSLTPRDLFGIFDQGFAGMIDMPLIIGDGHVIPDATAEQIFSDPQMHAQVPLIIGSNREETALFLGFDPQYVQFAGSMPVGINDVTAYRRDVRYSTDLWRASGVDAIAELASQHRPEEVFAYRFDVDDWRNLGFIDLKQWLGAAHALELPLVFGYFPRPIRLLIPDSTFTEIELVSNSIMSYWAQFAYTGNPGQGRNDEEIEWLPWRSTERGDSGHFLVLDTEIDQGVRMEREVLTEESVVQAFKSDTSFASDAARCASYRSVFWNWNYDQAEYESLGCQ